MRVRAGYYPPIDGVTFPDEIDEPTYVAFTDGSANNALPEQQRVAGWATTMMIVDQRMTPLKVRDYWGHYRQETSNFAELRAILEALRSVKDSSRYLYIVTDSQYSIDVITRRKNSVKNRGLLSDIWNQMISVPLVKFVKVPGHVGVYYNERADRIANFARATQMNYLEVLDKNIDPLSYDIDF
jgi:ribonuclease HI